MEFRPVTDQISLAIVGLGLVGARHVDAINAIGNAKLAAVAEPDPTGQAKAEKLGIDCYGDLPALFEHIKPDGIILATPTNLHVEQAMACINRNCPVLVEKPLCVSTSEGQELVQEAERKNVPILVGHHRRYNPLIQKAKEIIDNGTLGEVRAIHGHCWFYKPDDYFEQAPWRKHKGAGPVSVNLVHDIDLLRYLCGEVTSVQAQATRSKRGYDNEDLAAAVLRFDNDVIATITVSDSIVSPWSWELTSREYPIYPPTTESCYMLGGSLASLSIPDLRIWSHQDPQNWWSPISATSVPQSFSDPLTNQIKHFVDVIQKKSEPLVSGREGLKTLSVIETIQKAAETGETLVPLV